jgi:hypothetical protein
MVRSVGEEDRRVLSVAEHIYVALLIIFVWAGVLVDAEVI